MGYVQFPQFKSLYSLASILDKDFSGLTQIFSTLKLSMISNQYIHSPMKLLSGYNLDGYFVGIISKLCILGVSFQIS